MLLRKFLSKKKFTLHEDAFSSGQISSKIWACEQIEKVFKGNPKPITIWIYGGWQGVMGFLLLSRGLVSIAAVRSFDICVQSTKAADKINENWLWKNWTFKALTIDCNKINFESREKLHSEKPDLVINTAVEHFTQRDWWNNIPLGTTVLLQSTNMPHREHFTIHSSEKKLQDDFLLTEVEYSGSLTLKYPDKNLDRFMVLGVK